MSLLNGIRKYCSPDNKCGTDSSDGKDTTNANRMYSWNYAPKECRKLYSEIGLKEYNGFED